MSDLKMELIRGPNGKIEVFGRRYAWRALARMPDPLRNAQEPLPLAVWIREVSKVIWALLWPSGS